MRHSESDEKPRHLDRGTSAVCILLIAVVGNGMDSDLAAPANVSFFRCQEDECAHGVAFSGHIHDQTSLPNDPCDIEAVLQGASVRRYLQANNRPVLQQRFQSVVIPDSDIAAQFE